jgi:hypothetical protein
MAKFVVGVVKYREFLVTIEADTAAEALQKVELYGKGSPAEPGEYIGILRRKYWSIYDEEYNVILPGEDLPR